MLLVLYIGLTAAGLILIKIGRTGSLFAIKDNALTLSMNLKLFFGLAAYVLSFLLFVFISGRFEISYLYPIASGTIIVITVFFGAVALGETLTKFSIAGIALITAGVILINFK